MHNLATNERRTAIRWSYANAFVWALGNGFVNSSLIIYLAQSLGAKGLEVGLILAAPNFAGLLRLAAPSLLRWWGNRSSFVVLAYLLSCAPLACLAWNVYPTGEAAHTRTMAFLVVCWCAYQVLEYLGTVALWTWLGDLTPARLRGRFLGRREWYLLVGRVAGLALAGEFVADYQLQYPNYPAWIAYALPARAGVLLLLISALLLCFMPPCDRGATTLQGVPWRSLLAALVDARNRRLLVYRAWFSFFNGLTSSAQHVFLVRQLGLELRLRQLLEAGTHLGQSALATETGRWIDRVGNKPVMIISQLLVAAALGFLYLANAGERWWWITGAWVLWIAYVGLNVALPNITLRMAPRNEAAAYLAVNHAVAGLFAGFSMVAGGWLFDQLAPAPLGGETSATLLTGLRDWLTSHGLSRYQALFLFGIIVRSLGVFWIQRLDDRVADDRLPPPAKEPA